MEIYETYLLSELKEIWSQSNHCGMEITSSISIYPSHSRSQSNHCGMEIRLLSLNASLFIFVSIEPLWNGNFNSAFIMGFPEYRCLNRTIVEWKWRLLSREGNAFPYLCLNRTIVEWKLSVSVASPHHPSRLNRTIVEWKYMVACMSPPSAFQLRLNRTIVEWKFYYHTSTN